MYRIIRTIFFLFTIINIHAKCQDAELVYQETSITLRNGKLHKSLQYEIKINNRDGDIYNKVSIPYSKLNMISDIEAYLVDKNGEIVKKLRKGDIRNRSAISSISLYEDRFVKEFSLKHNSYPYSLIYRYKIVQNEYLFIDYWRPVIDMKIPTVSAVLKIELPKEYRVRFWEQLVEKPIVETAGSNILYIWHASYGNVYYPEVFSPPVNNFLPVVAVVPLLFNYDIAGNYYNWSSFGDWEYELIQGLFDLPSSEKNEILQIVKDIEEPLEKIKILYYYMQDNTRYINVSIETGGLKPHPASYVARNKFGDCKALTIYFKSILDFVGVQSFYSSIYAGGAISEIHKEFPSQQFNHVILCVPQESDTLWLDCTSDGPFNYIGTFIQNRDAFVIEISKSKFAKTPALSSNDVLESRTVSINVNPNGQSTSEVINTYKGNAYELLHGINNSFGNTDKSQIIRNNFIEDGFEIRDFRIIEPDRDSAKIHLSYSATSSTIMKQYGEEVLIDILRFSMPKFNEPKDRKMPAQIDYPIYKIDTIKYFVPELYDVSSLPANQEFTSDFGYFGIETIQKKDEIIVTKSFFIKPGYYTNDKYIKFYNFINSVSVFENNSKIVLAKNQ